MKRKSNTILWILLSIVVILIIGFGILSFKNYIKSENELRPEFALLKEKGQGYTIPECRDHVLTWFKNCQAMKKLCEVSVIKLMNLCLLQKNRHSECLGYESQLKKINFGFEECQDKEKNLQRACADIYHSIYDYCNHSLSKR